MLTYCLRLTSRVFPPRQSRYVSALGLRLVGLGIGIAFVFACGGDGRCEDPTAPGCHVDDGPIRFAEQLEQALCIKPVESVSTLQSLISNLEATDCSPLVDPGEEGFFETWHIFADETQTLVFDVESNFDNLLELMRVVSHASTSINGVIVAKNDDRGADNSQALISAILQAGEDYLLRLSGFNDDQTGSYTIAVSRVSTPLPPPSTGSVQVNVSSGGTTPSTYTVTLNGEKEQKVPANGGHLYEYIIVGEYSVALSDLGSCSVNGPNPQTVNVTAGQTVTVTFNVTCVQSHRLTVGGTGAGSGTITGAGSINCTWNGSSNSGVCSEAFQEGATVGLTATPQGSVFGGWSGACTGTGQCQVTMDQDKSVTARFNTVLLGAIQVNTATTGSGTDPNGYMVNLDNAAQIQNIGVSASVTFSGLSEGTHTVRLDDVASGCTVTSNNPQTVNVTAGQTTTVTFNVTCAQSPDLVISSGSPTATPSTVVRGSTTQLSAWTVRNQGDAASGGFSNGFYLSTNATITANDTYLTGNSNASLAAGEQHNWGGPTVTIPISTPPGDYYVGILVDRTDAVSESVESNNFVSTPITVLDHLVSLTVVINGLGSVASQGAEPPINCSYIEVECTESYPRGTSVTLVASQTHADFSWEDWSGTGTGFTCTTNKTCTVTMDQDRRVTARFSPPGRITVSPTSASFLMPEGGPATPASQTATVSHIGGRAVFLDDLVTTYSPSNVTAWLNASMSSMVIDSLSPQTLSLSVNSGAYALPSGVYTATVIIRDYYNFETVDVTLTVVDPNPTLTDISHMFVSSTCGISGTSWYRYTVDYLDADGDVTPSGTRVFVGLQFSNGTTDGYESERQFNTVTGDGFSGQVHADNCLGLGTASWADVTITIEDAGGNLSNPLTTRVTP
jgi:plastocyanin